jgi:deoxyhypusine synthase
MKKKDQHKAHPHAGDNGHTPAGPGHSHGHGLTHDHDGDHDHDHGHDCCGGCGHEELLSGPMIEPLKLAGNEAVADFIDNVYGKSGFNGRRLAEAAELYVRMLDSGATVAITLSGAMTPIGMSGVFNSLIEKGLVDLIISTGANLYHDLHRPFEFPMVQGHFEVDDNMLADDGVARIYDVFIGEEDTLMATDKVVMKALDYFDSSKPFSTATLHHAMGRMTWEHAKSPKKSMVAVASKYDLPIFTSSPGDSSIAMALMIPHMFKKPVAMNPMLDILETAAIVRDADSNGVVEIGGGSPKNFYLQTQPMLQQFLYDGSKGGHDYFLQLTADAPHWGGLSGATPGEAKSWGKIKDAYTNNVVVYSCASLTFPLIAQYALVRAKPRKPRRLFKKIGPLCDKLIAAARKNEALREQYPQFFGKKKKVGK